MKTHISLHATSIHVWYAWLPDFLSAEDMFMSALSPDEISRAMRFHLPLNRQRYVATRAILRELISRYILQRPICFSYGDKGKPYVQDCELEFNVSHSEDLAVFAFARNHAVGIDTEKLSDKNNRAVAMRFFTEEEFRDYLHSNCENNFYKIWCAKEAIIKTFGGGVWTAKENFSVRLCDAQCVDVVSENKIVKMYVNTIPITPEYQVCLSTTANNYDIQVLRYAF